MLIVYLINDAIGIILLYYKTANKNKRKKMRKNLKLAKRKIITNKMI